MSGIVGQNAGRDSGVVGTVDSSIADDAVTLAVFPQERGDVHDVPFAKAASWARTMALSVWLNGAFRP